jgi:hypothetical protein
MSKTLQQKNTRYLLIWLPLVLLIGTILFYILMSAHAHHMEEEQLELKQENIWNAFLTNPVAPASQITGEYDLLPGTPVRAGLLHQQRDTSIYYPAGKEWVVFKILTEQHLLKGQPYQLTTYVSFKEVTHLIVKVFIADHCLSLRMVFDPFPRGQPSMALLYFGCGDKRDKAVWPESGLAGGKPVKSSGKNPGKASRRL